MQVLPFKYDKPGGELLVILVTTFVHKELVRVNSTVVSGINSTEYYLATGLPYASDPRFVIEGNSQLPVVRNTGLLVLRNGRNILFGKSVS